MYSYLWIWHLYLPKQKTSDIHNFVKMSQKKGVKPFKVIVFQNIKSIYEIRHLFMKTVAQAVTLFIVHVRFVSFKTPELAYSCLVLHQMHTNHQMKNCHEVSPATRLILTLRSLIIYLVTFIIIVKSNQTMSC